MVVAAGAIVVEFAISFAGGVYGAPSRSIIGPASSLDSSGSGTAAFAQLLTDRKHPVRQLTVPVSTTTLPVPGTLFVLDPQGELTSDLATLHRYLAAGGRVVLAGRPATATLRALLGAGPLPVWQATTTRSWRPGAPEPETYGVRTVVSDTLGAWQTATSDETVANASRPVRILLGGSRGALALLVLVGRGRLVLLATGAPLDNAHLADADNAALALDLAGPDSAPAIFDEYDHGLGRPGSGIAGLPGHWQVALLLALVAVLVWMLSAARRLGPPLPAERELVPPRIAHVDAVASLLASGSAARLVAGADPLRQAARERLVHVLRAPRDSTDADLVAAASTLLLPPDVVASVLGEPRSEADLIALGRAYATLAEKGR